MSKQEIVEQPKDKVKDAILLKHGCVFSQQQFLGGKGREPLANEEVSGVVSNVYAAMDEYAKQISMGFNDWLKDNSYTKSEKGWYKYYQKVREAGNFTMSTPVYDFMDFETIYQLYINSLK